MPKALKDPVVEEKKDEVVETPPEKKREKGFDYAKDSKRSFKDIAKEVDSSSKNDDVEDHDEEQNDQETRDEKSTDTKPEEKHEEEPALDAQKIAEDAAAKAAEQSREAFKKELQDIKDSEQSALDKKHAEDELVSVFDREKRLPTDYREIFNEAQRLAEVKMRQSWEAKEQERKTQAEQKAKQEEDAKTQAQRAQEERSSALQERMKLEMEELYIAKELPRPRDGVSNKETEDLYKFGIKLNQDRVTKGQPPVDSLSRLYFLYYRPAHPKAEPTVEQPAGADAPVSGAKSGSQPTPEDRYVYARDHGKGWRQLVYDTVHGRSVKK